ncbi:benzaldehyde dehydrogenase [Novosphingobium terrae]|uniref:benzaldehyde dehydrogenase n=1 Tax=Novosphingobium terrae TaxID=2726189 RepID=UPI00197F6440|nr:benzaldehyde dehydrogenase [Novosphingobium terrae]
MTQSAFLTPAQIAGQYFTGEWVTGGKLADAVAPGSGAVLGQIAMVTPEILRASSAAARKAQQGWAAASPDARAEVFLKALEIGRTHSEEIIDWVVRESGSVRAKAGFELSVTLKSIQLAAAMPHQAQGLILPSEPGRTSLARRRPLGVVGVISPFNFPLYLAMRAVAPALAVGNAVVLKPDPRTAICGGLVIARLFELAGLPAGLLHVLPGDGAVGEALCTDPDVAMIQFTGSTGAGRMVGRTASEHLKKVSLELGGKNALVVLEDADLDLAVKNAAWGTWLHQGQICMTAGRVFVQRSIVEEFSRRLAEKARVLPVGDPATQDVAVGPIINARQFDHIARVVSQSQSDGAQLLAGGPGEGLFFNPTVLAGVTPHMAAYKEEIFGPVAVIVPFDTDEEAIAMANDTEYGLSAAVISRDVARALALGDRLHAGLLHINDQTVNDDVVNPFGGVGASGNGTSIGGPANWEEFTHWQWVTIKSAPPAYPF